MPRSHHRRRPPVRAAGAAAALSAVIAIAGCGSVQLGETAPVPAPAHTAPPAPARLHGQAARASAAVSALSRALRDGDVARLCRPGAIFTRAVVAEMNAGGASCEASDETSTAITNPPALTVVALAFKPDLATAKVSVEGRTVPLDIVRHGGRWLVSFSDGNDPLAALLA